MKKQTIWIAIAIISFSSIACVKDWKCECTDGTTSATVAIYPDTKRSDAKKSCDEAESLIGNPDVSCSVK
ncbi:MAG: hypothetical protein R2807_10860 [Chitinophagales bacterium]